MTFREYQIGAEKTAIYDEKYKERYKVTYPAHGLTGEAGEVVDKFKKQIRDNNVSDIDIALELGDVLWYIAISCRDLDLSIGVEELNSVRYDCQQSTHMLAVSLANTCSMISVKMLACGKGGVSCGALYHALCYVSLIGDRIGYTLEEIAKMNLAKLERRMQNGTIHGSGDNR